MILVDINIFEDVIQFYSARSVNAEAIITRNKKHFRVVENRIRVQTPEEFPGQEGQEWDSRRF